MQHESWLWRHRSTQARWLIVILQFLVDFFYKFKNLQHDPDSFSSLPSSKYLSTLERPQVAAWAVFGGFLGFGLGRLLCVERRAIWFLGTCGNGSIGPINAFWVLLMGREWVCVYGRFVC